MGTEKKYWTGIEELNETEEFIRARDNEFASDVPVEEFVANTDSETMSTGRRDFLKFLGFSVGAATMAACETPVTYVVPYVNKPEEVTPGMPTYYASTYSDGTDYASIIIKTREGRPIYVKGNKDYGLGAVSARINSSVLSLYDSTRLTGPQKKGGESVSWANADADIKSALSGSNGSTIAFLTNSMNSPSSKAAIAKLRDAYPGATVEHVMVDAVSFEGMRRANQASFGRSVLPWYNFNKARVVVSVSADFMNGWPMGEQYSADFAKTRKPENGWMSKHYQFETLMSVAGSNADVRHAIKPSEEGLVLASIYKAIVGGGSVDTSSMDSKTAGAIAALKANKGKSLVISGSNDENIQMIVNAINESLGNYGQTIELNKSVNLAQGSFKSFKSLVDKMSAGRVKTLFMHGVNPAYDSPMAAEFKAALAKVGTSVSFSMHADETASLCSYILPDNHYMESWNDYNAVGNHYALQQPVIRPLGDTRQWQDSFLNWAGVVGDYYAFIKSRWTATYALRHPSLTGSAFWNKSLHDGSVNLSSLITDDSIADDGGVAAGASGSVASALQAVASKAKESNGFELVLYTNTGIGNGKHTTNPWLQELPDPITKICWDNYVTMAPADLKEKDWNDQLGEQLPATMVKLTVDGKSLELPAVMVPGQKAGTLGVALGYGRAANGENIGNAAFQTKEYGGYKLNEAGNRIPIGANGYALLNGKDDVVSYSLKGASVEATGAEYLMAATQTHHTLMDRTSVVRETTIAEYNTGDHKLYNPPHALVMHEDGKTVMKPVSEVDLWDAHPIEDIGHWWGMTIDLTSCTGCSACVTACHSENNVPVVGKDEVRRARDMHWMRIDRYFTSDMTKERGAAEGKGTIYMYSDMEIPSDNPAVVHMPMMCQHCNHAPCETVCPVAATTHSSEGINQMTYNRCIGTRYCANNCPYKVRRFNWFNYKAYGKFTEVNPSQDVLGRLVLNPDVTVRSRGVMEKCSMCTQRIQAGKLDAKLNKTPVPDGSIQTACAEACPTNAITFGDLNDKKSKAKARKDDPRAYMALEETGTRPSVAYMALVRNTDDNNA